MAKGKKKRLTLLQDLLEAGGYAVRYERGHFRTGHCLVHERRVIVVNKFFDEAARVQKLEELIADLDISPEGLDDALVDVLSGITSTPAPVA